MKKIILASVAMLLLSTGAMAQDQQRQQRREFNPEEMIQRRTQGMVEKYGLNEKQSAELLELNKNYATKMGPRAPFGRRDQGARPNRDRRNRQMNDTLKNQRPQRPERNNDARPENRPNMAEMKAVMDEYNAKLKTIMTEEQFKAYQEDQNKMRQQGPRGGFRQHKNDNNKSE